MTTTDKTPGINPKQTAFLLLDEKEAMYGGSAGGGKSEALLIGALQDVEDFPTASLLLRRTYRDLDKAGGLMFRARQWLAPTDAHWDGINKRWTFPNGATLDFGFMEHDGDELKYQSSEYHYVGFDELTHFPEYQYLYLFSRMRRLKGTPVGLRMRSGTNPGGPGHEWVMRRWDLPKGPVDDPNLIFISANINDNPFLEQQEYIENLSMLGDVTKAQLLDGDWTAASTGGYFEVENLQHVGWGDIPPIKDFVAIVRYWDFAATEPSEDNPDPDYTVGLKLGMVMNKETRMFDWYVFDVERFRGNPGTVENRVRAVGERDGPLVVQWLEQERGAAGKLNFRNFAVNVLPNSTCRPLYATGTKEARAKIAAARVNEKRVYIVDGEWNPFFVAELGIFPLGSFDDQVDGISNALISIDRERVFSDQGDVTAVGGRMAPVERVGNVKSGKINGHYGYP